MADLRHEHALILQTTHSMRPSTRQHFVAILATAFVATILLIAFSITSANAPPKRRLEIDRGKGEIRLRVRVYPNAMRRPFGVKGHHAIVWNEGKASRWALFRAEASDLEVRQALQQLGARPGENLTVETWEARQDSTSREPDKRVEGTPIDVLVSWPRGRERPLYDFLENTEGGAPDFRYGGNQQWRDHFKSGCIVCLYSCPGGAIGNRNRTIRDYTREGVIYFADKARLPKSGTEVTIILRPRLEES